MDQTRTPLTVTPPHSTSPPPNCAICLGTCKKRCFSDSCMHQFCFRCLLKWSRVKAECPLCKQPFRSIIHNVRSSSKYDKHDIPQNEPERADALPVIDNETFMYIPTSSRRYINLENDRPTYLPRALYSGSYNSAIFGIFGNFRSRRSDNSGINFRRSVYSLNLWVNPPYFSRGTYLSPQYFRENPAARQRLVPWLNRELNVLLYENTQHVMYVVDIILEQLLVHHILSSSFRIMLSEYLGSNNDHFIHEFYNFMRSPYDMIEYDRHIVCLNRDPPPPVNVVSDNDSDVVVVTPNPQENVIEIVSDSDNSDVILQEPPPPEIVDLVDDSEENVETREEPAVPEPEQRHSPILPLKIRLKHKRRSREKSRRGRSRRHTRTRSSSSSSSREDTPRKRRRRLKSHRKRPRRKPSADSSSGSGWQVVRSSDQSTDTEDDVPLSKLLKKEEVKDEDSKTSCGDKSPGFADCVYERRVSFVGRFPEVGEPGPQSSCRFQEGSAGGEEDLGEFCRAGPSAMGGIGREGERTVWYEQLMSWCGGVGEGGECK